MRETVRKIGNWEIGGLQRSLPVSRFPSYLLCLLALAAGCVYLAGYGGAWRAALKAAPVLALAIWTGRRGGAVTLGLLVSAAGDAILDLGTFLPGVAAFAMAHVFYVCAFVRAERNLRPVQAIPFAIWGAFAYGTISPALDDMALPVALYMVVICAMMWRAAAQSWRSPRRLAWLGLAGAVLFGASDTLIAFARWRPGFAVSGLAIMALYWGGQALIAAWGTTAISRSSP